MLFDVRAAQETDSKRQTSGKRKTWFQKFMLSCDSQTNASVLQLQSMRTVVLLKTGGYEREDYCEVLSSEIEKEKKVE